MYGLPKDFDAAPFIGRVLEMVCFNVNQIYLHFDNRVTITIEGGLIYKSTEDIKKLSPPVLETNLMQLIGSKVTSAVGQNNGTLSLTFDNKSVIECLDVSKDYESYQIAFEDRTIIV